MAERRGIVARFADEAALVSAARRLQAAGFGGIETYTPYSVEALEEPPSRVPRIVLIGAVIGLALGLGLQQYATVIDYPVDIGGRPLDSWPMYLPTAYEFLVGSAVVFGTVALLVLAGLPRYHHPIFALADFEHATADGFFLAVTFDPDDDRHSRLQEELTRCRPLAVTDLPSA
jgi:hypothetical protein